MKGREVTGFTNSEEEAVGLTKVVPLLVEDTMIALGAKYSKVDDWQPYTCQDGNSSQAKIRPRQRRWQSSFSQRLKSGNARLSWPAALQPVDRRSAADQGG